MNEVMAVTGEPDFASPEQCSDDDHPDVWSLARELRRRDGPWTNTNAPVVAPATHQINMAAACCASVALVAVIAANVDPLRSIGRPYPAPTAIVGGVGKGRANERKAMEAVMEEPVMERKSRRETGVYKMRTPETGAAETHAAAMPAAAAAMPTTAAAMAATPVSERR
jgi:hypothetical protein